MSEERYRFSLLKENIIYIKSDVKEKKKEYGIITINKDLINALQGALELLSSSPSITAKFSKKIESFLIPRFEEIMGIIYSVKTLPDEIGIEISKENVKDIEKGLLIPRVMGGLEQKGYSSKQLKNIFNQVKFSK